MNLTRVIVAPLLIAAAACGSDAAGETAEPATASGPAPTTVATVKRTSATTRPATTSNNRAVIELSGGLTFSYDGPGGKCTTTTRENFSDEAEEEGLVLEITAYEFDPADGSFDLTLFDENNDGSVEGVILNGREDKAHWSLAKGSGTPQGRTDLKGVTFDVELGSMFNAHPPVKLKGSIACD